jgi:hypothetical protein
MTRTDRFNRVGLAIFGIVLTAAGVYGLCRSYGAFGAAPARDPFLLEGVRSFVGRNHDWLWPVAFVVVLALAYFGYRVLRAELSIERHPKPIHDHDGADDVVVPPSVVADAIADDLERAQVIRKARVRLRMGDEVPQVDLDITVPDDAALNDVRHEIRAEALERARAALESPPLRSRVIVSLAEPTGRRLD